MIHVWKKFGIILIVAMAVTACNHLDPVYNIDKAPVPNVAQQKFSSEQIGDIIAKAALNKGWVVDKAAPGLLHCTKKWNNHSAMAGIETAFSCLNGCSPESITSSANITYSKQSYSIQLDPSQNLNQSDDVTYRRYNQYIQQLQSEIDMELSKAAYK